MLEDLSRLLRKRPDLTLNRCCEIVAESRGWSSYALKNILPSPYEYDMPSETQDRILLKNGDYKPRYYRTCDIFRKDGEYLVKLSEV